MLALKNTTKSTLAKFFLYFYSLINGFRFTSWLNINKYMHKIFEEKTNVKEVKRRRRYNK
jgi:hypothetical protein